MLLEKTPCYPANTMEKTWRKPTENPRSKTPSFSRKHCYCCSNLKKHPVIQPQNGENVEKTQDVTRPRFSENTATTAPI